MRFIDREPIRFLLAGGINTVVTYLVYLALLDALGYRLAFSTAFVLGILLGYQLNIRFVFRTTFSLRKMLQYPVVYLAQYFLGLAFIAMLVELAGINQKIAPLINVALMIPLTYVINRWFLLGKERHERMEH